MPKRQGYIYDCTWQWDTLKEADRVSTRRKKNYGVKKHKKQWLKDLVEVQQLIIDRKIKTDEYQHMKLKNGKKERDISKLNFHPNHEWHQSLVLVSHDRIERTLISHTYASRIGYGQIAAALQVKRWLRENREECRWFAQGDICHYYANILHALLRQNLEHIFKDKEFIDAFENAHVTSFKTVVIDKGGSHFEFSQVKILTIDHRQVAKSDDGKLIYTDTNEVVDLTKFNNKKEETKQ